MTSETERRHLLDRAELHPAALAVLEQSALAKENWLIAFSGGADSLALLLTVSALWPGQSSRVIAAHFNHALRGAESDEDERFCAEVSRARALQFVSARWTNPPASASEAQARAARFEFFSKVALERDCRVLLTGHHLDDVIETIFMRVARGASSAGLAAPRPVRLWREDNYVPDHAGSEIGQTKRLIVRPLLSQSSQQIRARLSAAGFSWREDASNQGGDFLRNRIRRDVVPNWLQAAGSSAYAGGALTREWLEEDDAALEAWLDELGIEKVVTRLPLGVLARKPRALVRRAVRRWRGAETLSRAGFEALLALIETGRGQVSAGEGRACIEDGFLVWRELAGATSTTPAGSVEVVAPISVFLPDGAKIEVRALSEVPDWRERLAARKIDPAREAFVAAPDAAGFGPLTIRFWQPGDRYGPLGLGGTAKLQDLFVNRKTALADRHRLPIILGPGGQIVWVPGFAPAEYCRFSPDKEWGVQLTYVAGTSTVS